MVKCRKESTESVLMTMDREGSLDISEQPRDTGILREIGQEALELAIAAENIAKWARTLSERALAASVVYDQTDDDTTLPQSETNIAEVVDIASHIHHGDGVQFDPVPEDDDLAVDRRIDDETEPIAKRLNSFLKKFINGTVVDCMQLTKRDNGMIIQAITDLYTPFDPRESQERFSIILEGFAADVDNAAITKMVNDGSGDSVSQAAIEVGISNLPKRILKRAAKRKDGKTPDQVVSEYVARGRSVDSLAPEEGSTVGDEELDETEYTLDELLEFVTDEDTRSSVGYLLRGERFDSETMEAGVRFLGTLVDKYMPSVEGARQWLGNETFYSESYKGLIKLAGRKMSQGEIQQTLHSLIKYNKSMEEETITRYIRLMLLAEKDAAPIIKSEHEGVIGEDVSEPQPIPVVVEKESKELPDLWSVISGYEHPTKQEADAAISVMLDKAVVNKHITKAQALSIRADLLNEEDILDASDKREMLAYLNQKYREVNARHYSRLHETPEFTYAFAKYTAISEQYGAQSIRDIIERLNGNIMGGGKITRQKFTLEVAAVMQVVFAELDDKQAR